ncbi:MAG: hypothetical protein IJ193_00855 [Bacilli bacterium]|nr:hypothetical protein [Bacilli bacterium]
MKFEKVSFDAFKKDLIKCGIFENDEDNKIKEAYDNIQLPKRSTTGSCGYDFVTPMDVTIVSYKTTLIPTGIKVILEEGYFLMLCPRSSCVKRGYTMTNNLGIIDYDYKDAENEGNIMVPLASTNRVSYAISFETGDAIAQGIILPYFKVEDDNATGTRNGGFGSTDKQEEVTKMPSDKEDLPEIENLNTADYVEINKYERLYDMANKTFLINAPKIYPSKFLTTDLDIYNSLIGDIIKYGSHYDLNDVCHFITQCKNITPEISNIEDIKNKIKDRYIACDFMECSRKLFKALEKCDIPENDYNDKLIQKLFYDYYLKVSDLKEKGHNDQIKKIDYKIQTCTNYKDLEELHAILVQ